MSSSAPTQPPFPQIDNLTPADHAEWLRLFRAYIDFYNAAATFPEAQYARTFARLVDPATELEGIVLRAAGEGPGGGLVGFAHFYPHQTPWNERMIMHLNDLFVDPHARGGGHGRAMILAVAEHAEAKGCFRLEWATAHGNPARKLYDQLGSCDFVEYRRKLGG